MTPIDILKFWFTKPMTAHWFNSTDDIDNLIRDNFEQVWLQAQTDELDDWKKTPEGLLALVLLFDQFPLNMYRRKPLSFSTEKLAIDCTKKAISQDWFADLEMPRKLFFLMPLMHSEQLSDQDLAIKTGYAQGWTDEDLHFFNHHKNIIKQFGRFPHRNIILGRKSSQEEINYLQSDNAFNP